MPFVCNSHGSGREAWLYCQSCRSRMMQRFAHVVARAGNASRSSSLLQTRRALATRMSKSHEFAKLEGEIATVGITDHAAGALGDIVYVDLPSIGAKYKAGDTFGSVESVKAASDVYAPIAGEVMEVNSALEETPGKVNESPFEGGWFIKLKVDAAGKAEFAKLMVRYREGGRKRDRDKERGECDGPPPCKRTASDSCPFLPFSTLHFFRTRRPTRHTATRTSTDLDVAFALLHNHRHHNPPPHHHHHHLTNPVFGPKGLYAIS